MELAPVSKSQHYAFCAPILRLRRVFRMYAYLLRAFSHPTQLPVRIVALYKVYGGPRFETAVASGSSHPCAARVLPLFSPILSRTFEPGVLGVLGTRSKENPASGRWRSPPAGFLASKRTTTTTTTGTGTSDSGTFPAGRATQ